MLGVRHPFSRALYEQDGNGNVRVTLDDAWGLFRPDGTWIEGEIFEADPQLCGWVGGPKVAHHRIHVTPSSQQHGSPASGSTVAVGRPSAR